MPDAPETAYRTNAYVPPPPAPPSKLLAATGILFGITLAIIPINFFVVSWSSVTFEVLAYAQLAAGVGALVCGVTHATRKRSTTGWRITSALIGIMGGIAGLGGPFAILLVKILESADWSGGAWGRPLRLRGRILHPRLRAGSDWARGDRPDPSALDEATRRALEALWLHDAQKEHASVPAFARISWLLAAVGAPAELVEGAHRAALEEVDHARRCFALAAGYGGRSHGVEPMPDLLVGGLDLGGDPLARLASESLTDGCLLEDFNADVATACEAACDEPAVKDVLGRIAREERSHAAFSWDLLRWLLDRADDRVRRAVVRAARALADVPRPTAVSSAVAPLAAHADMETMRRHGRIPDAAWAKLWAERLTETRRRVDRLLASAGAGDVHGSGADERERLSYGCSAE